MGNKFLAYLLCGALVVDSSGRLGVRNFVFILLAPTFFFRLGFFIDRRWFGVSVWLMFVWVAFPFYSLLVGVIGGGDLPLGFSQLSTTVAVFLLIPFVVVVGPAVVWEVIVFILVGLAVFSVALFVGSALGFQGVRQVIDFFSQSSGGYFGDRGVGEAILPNVYFPVTLFYVPAAVYLFLKGRLFCFFICFLGLVAGLSKTGVFVILFFLLFWAFYKSLRYGIVAICCFFAAAVFLGGIFSGELFDAVSGLLGDSTVSTVSVRMGHWESFLHEVDLHPMAILSGFGLGTYFFSSGEWAYVSNIEIDHVNVVRKYGILYAVIFFSSIIWVSYRLIVSCVLDNRVIGFCLLVAFFVSGTNPVLMSPVFLLFYLCSLGLLISESIGSCRGV